MLLLIPLFDVLVSLFSLLRLFLFCFSFIESAVALAHRPATVMFQRLREAIDSRIAEEQARQRSSQESLARSNSARRPPGRNLSPGRRPSRTRRNTGTPVRGPDPTEFEPEFAIGDDDASSRSATPKPESTETPDNSQGEKSGEKSGEARGVADTAANGKDSAPPTQESAQPSAELPPEVRAKLRKLNKLESRYQGMRYTHYSAT
ncbi:hypothetical protein BJX63DRAFT_58414 [Aspergillus granulosus]|uniref:Uncharacterized protein n=1 Tax=Aspergillus granulosus TaxID=176169 RepID=A0ABR4HTA8_9EURO